MQKMRSNFESIDDQMMCRDVPRLVETCTSHIERYGLRVRKVYQNKLLEFWKAFLFFGIPWTCGCSLLDYCRKMIARPQKATSGSFVAVKFTGYSANGYSLLKYFLLNLESGLYRISGLASRIKALEQSFEKCPLSFEIDADVYKVHDVTVLLKTFFRKLQMPLFCPNEKWIEVHQMVKSGKMIQFTELATHIISTYSEVTQGRFEIAWELNSFHSLRVWNSVQQYKNLKSYNPSLITTPALDNSTGRR